VGLQLVHRPLERLAHVLAAAGDAAGALADADLADPGLARHPRRAVRARAGLLRLLARQEVPDRLVDGARGQIAVRGAVDLHHRRQRAAADAGDLVDRDLALRVRVLVRRDPAAQLDAVDDQLRALHVAGGADADIDRMLAGGLMAEFRVERRDAGDAR